MKLIVGLGNPGQKYVQTRHNVGFQVIAKLAQQFETGRAKAQFHGETVDFQVSTSSGLEKIVLLTPLTYMNESGRSVRAAIDFFQLDVESELLVICDDFNLDFARIRLRPKGSSGGQRGLEDIIRHIGQNFCRLRLGIGAPPDGWKVPDYVLSRFREEEKAELEVFVQRSVDAALCWAEEGIQEAMNRYNVVASSRVDQEESPDRDKSSSTQKKQPKNTTNQTDLSCDQADKKN